MDRPILFKDNMVRAILEGRKTQTRRILDVPTGWSLEGPQGSPASLGKITSSHPKRGRFGAFIRQEVYSGSGKFTHDVVTCKYGEPGDRLWVRETHAIVPRTAYAQSAGVQQVLRPDDNHDAAIFREGFDRSMGGIRWRPSIHMPRWASRITLEITDVRVERLQDISGEDAASEGACNPIGSPRAYGVVTGLFAIEQFERLWQSINGPDSWDANPWVWVIEFRRVD